jgi:hypothetical protein
MLTVLFNIALISAGLWSLRLLLIKINAERRSQRDDTVPGSGPAIESEQWSDHDEHELNRLLDDPRN